MNKEETEKIEEVCQTPTESEESSSLLEKTERYLVEIAGCLFDVRMALDAAKLGANLEKADLIRVGRDFAYQQGIIDFCTELAKYASGEICLMDAVNELLEAKRKMMEEGAEIAAMDTQGMEVV